MSKRVKNLMARELVGEFGSFESCVLVRMGRIDVQAVTELRNDLREKGVRLTVLKNRIATHALKEVGWDGLTDLLSGPSALAYGEGGALAASKVLAAWEKKSPDGVAIRGGLLEGELLQESDVRELASVPDKPVLYAMLAAGVIAPVAQVATLVTDLLAGVARAVGAVADKQGGDA